MVMPFRPALAGEKVLHVGDVVAMVVAESTAAALDAAHVQVHRGEGVRLRPGHQEPDGRAPRLRHAALEAAIQFGSRDAIPTLVDAAAQTDDPKEKQAFLDAAEFLKLPSLTEVMAKGGAKTGAQPVVNRLRPAMPPRK